MKTVLFVLAIVGLVLSLPYFVFKGMIPYLSCKDTNDERKIDSMQAMLVAFVVLGISIMTMYFLL